MQKKIFIYKYVEFHMNLVESRKYFMADRDILVNNRLVNQQKEIIDYSKKKHDKVSKIMRQLQISQIVEISVKLLIIKICIFLVINLNFNTLK